MSELPSYAAALAAFHRCAAPALRTIVQGLPIEEGAKVLDAPCGDGTYLPWLRERAGKSGRVVGADRSRAYLDIARKHAAGADIELVETTFDALPSGFDFVWCAHSLYSLPDPREALAKLRGTLVPGGRIGVVENDSFHHWLLPWPVELELAVRGAQLAELSATQPHWTRAYVGRNLAPLLAETGFEEIAIRTLSVDHEAPLSEDQTLVLRDYLSGLKKLTWPRLDPAARAMFDEFERSFEGQADFVASHLEVVATARRPVV